MASDASSRVRSLPAAIVPTLDTELSLARSHPAAGSGVVVAGLDEVGRGALAGPVVVGACAVRILPAGIERPLPDGVRDSKALTARRREGLVAPIRQAALAHATGWASPAEIDERGILAALALAAGRALAHLPVPPEIVLMDGDADIVTPALGELARQGRAVPRSLVHLQVKADRDCQSVAAASVLAKVERDQHMVELDALATDYGWAGNKGYGSAAHREALRRLGAHPQHRRSWNLGLPSAEQEPGVLWGGAGDQPRPLIPKEAQP